MTNNMDILSIGRGGLLLLVLQSVFTEVAPRPIKSISCDVRGCVCAIGLDLEPHGLETSG